jgi:2'-5' RNA ligase
MPEKVKAEVERAQAELRCALTGSRISWTKREQFHLTLKFLRNVEASRTVVLEQVLRTACQDFATLSLRAEGVSVFPNHRFPRVVWAGVFDRQDALPRLQRAVLEATRSFAAEEPEKEFTGHVTLGRIKAINRSQSKVLAVLASRMAGRFFGEWSVNKIVLMRSELLPEGARHACLASIPLGDSS